MIIILSKNTSYTGSLFKAILLCICLLFPTTTNAIPAKNRPITITQADGTKLTIKLYGDEFFRYTTTLSGDPIAQKDGIYYYVNYKGSGEMQFSSQRASQQKNSSGERAYLSRRQTQNMSQIASFAATKRRQEMFPRGMQEIEFPTTGTVKCIVVLVEFSDVMFKTGNTRDKFDKRLNEVNYSDYPASIPPYYEKAKGSARDYFLKASNGSFTGEFDVRGPYRLSGVMADYGGNVGEGGSDKRPREMVIEAVGLAAGDGVNFAQYDNNNDGDIDNVFIYYAGYNEAEGGPANSIWPHMWSVLGSGSEVKYDGKRLNVYACSSELVGIEGTTMAGIGTFVHEFGHVFGLADHYDTDNEIGGLSNGLGNYDVMTSGGYNNEGFTPPMYTALEMELCNWLIPTVITSNIGQYDLPAIGNHKAYRINTEVEGEYFLIENRQRGDADNHWDKYIPGSGMLITHVDRSQGAIPYWDSNRPNNDTARERYRIVRAQNGNLDNPWNDAWANVLYPSGGNREFNNKSTPRAASWGGIPLADGISNISSSKSIMTFDIGEIKSSITAWQTDAQISWSDTGNDKFRVSLKRGNDQIKTFDVSTSKCELTDLNPATTYNVTISALGDSELEIKLFSTTLTTIPKVTDFPIIYLSDYEYAKETPIILKAINLTEGDAVSWNIDDVDVTETSVTLEAGKHSIKAVVKRGEVEYVAIKTILIR